MRTFNTDSRHTITVSSGEIAIIEYALHHVDFDAVLDNEDTDDAEGRNEGEKLADEFTALAKAIDTVTL